MAIGVGALIDRQRDDWTITEKEAKFLPVITASVAKDVLREEQKAGMFPTDKKEYIRVVDNKLGMVEERVRFGGKIHYQLNTEGFAGIIEVLRWIEERLVLTSPYRNKRPQDTGWRGVHYKEAHILMIDGKSVGEVGVSTQPIFFARTFQSRKHSKDSTYTFVNTMPYARRIEHAKVTRSRKKKRGSGFTKPKSGAWSQQAPNGVYRRVASEARARFGETIRVRYRRFQLRGIGYKILDMKKKSGETGQWYPAIVVRPKSHVTKGHGAIG